REKDLGQHSPTRLQRNGAAFGLIVSIHVLDPCSECFEVGRQIAVFPLLRFVFQVFEQGTEKRRQVGVILNVLDHFGQLDGTLLGYWYHWVSPLTITETPPCVVVNLN